MIVLSLFDGMSCGQIALRELGAKVDLYIASEIDKYAIANTMANFPNTVQIGSVTDIDVKELVAKYGVPDLMFGGNPCFAAGVMVLTKTGYKPIEEIEVGDEVLTHKNRYRKVLRVGNKIAQTYTFRAQGFLRTECTANHPFYARKKNHTQYIQENGKHTYRIKLGEAEWVKTEELPQKYYVCENIPSDTCENPLEITEEEAYILGRYIADGHTRKDLRFDKHHNGSRAWQLILSIGNKKVMDFCSHIKVNHYSCYPHGDSVHRVVFSNKRLVQIAEEQCGIGSTNKVFGEKLIKLPNELLSKVLEGFLDGDGCRHGKHYRVTTVSRLLALSMQRVVAKLFHKHVQISEHHPSEYRELCGRVVHQNKLYIIAFADHDLNTQERSKIIEDKIWTNAKSFESPKEQTVYNIEVEEDNSYTANNFVVHNCQSFSMSGKMKGMSTVQGEEIYTLDRYLELKNQGFEFEGQSYLFWEYMRILTELREINPNIYFFLENVEMLDKWERCLSHAIGVRGVHINAALVSAQNRRRIYWSNIRVKEHPTQSLFAFDDDPFELPRLETDIPQPNDTGEVIKDVVEDGVDGKYYLRDKLTEELLQKTDYSKLKEYLITPQMSVEEIQNWLDAHNIEDNAEEIYNEEKERLVKLYERNYPT